MDLLERYIHEVGKHLPRTRRADILTALRSKLVESLKSQVEGEPTEEDINAMLKEIGSPEQMAAEYWPESQYLIGPGLYPLFRTILGIALTILVIVNLVLLVIAAVFHPETLAALDFIGDFLSGIFTTFGITVLVFAILQRLDVRPEWKEKVWDPAELPAFEESDAVRSGSILVEITVNLILAVLLIYFPGRILVAFTPESTQVVINTVLVTYIPLLVLGLLLNTGLDIFLLWRGRWEVASRLAKIAINLFGIYVLAVLIAGHNAWLLDHNAAGFFTVLSDFPQDGPIPAETLEIFIMQIFRMAFIIAIFAVAVDTVQQGYRMLRRVI